MGIVFHFLVILLYCWNLKVVEVSESGFISSEKVALALVLRATSVAPLSCSKLLLSSRTQGPVVSGSSRTKTSPVLLVSFATRFEASDSKATKRPSELIEGS